MPCPYENMVAQHVDNGEPVQKETSEQAVSRILFRNSSYPEKRR